LYDPGFWPFREGVLQNPRQTGLTLWYPRRIMLATDRLRIAKKIGDITNAHAALQ
jgi:hypothetical protein